MLLCVRLSDSTQRHEENLKSFSALERGLCFQIHISLCVRCALIEIFGGGGGVCPHPNVVFRTTRFSKVHLNRKHLQKDTELT